MQALHFLPVEGLLGSAPLRQIHAAANVPLQRLERVAQPGAGTAAHFGHPGPGVGLLPGAHTCVAAGLSVSAHCCMHDNGG